MLQRGFSWRERGDDHIFVYKKNSDPKQTVTRKYGQAKNFYGDIGSAADTNITNFENSIQEFIHHVRASDHNQEVDQHLAALLVSHLETRSRFLREDFSRLSARLITGLEKLVSDRNSAKRLILKYLQNHPELIDEYVANQNFPRNMRKPFTEFLLRSLPGQLDSVADELPEVTKSFSRTLLTSLAQTIRDAHNSALEREFSETNRTKQHRQMRFLVWRTSGGLILPDTNLAFFKKNGCSPISQKGDDIEAVVVPVSTHAAIIGSSEGPFERGEKTLQAALASCAFESFIAPMRSPDLVRLAGRISKNARLITDAEMRRMLTVESFLNL